MPAVLLRRPDAKLVIVGDGQQRDRLLSRAQELGIKDKVVLVGLQENVECFLSAFDVFAFPSLFEGLGLAAVEAQANGLPVIMSNNVPALANVSQSARAIDLNDKNSWIYWLSNSSRESFIGDSEAISKFDISATSRELANYLTGC